jgi:hypothetical protein
MLFTLDPDADYRFYSRGPEEANERRDHIVLDGKSICSNPVSVQETASPASLEEFTKEDWSELMDSASNLCAHCRKKMVRSEVVPEQYRVQSQQSTSPDGKNKIPSHGSHIYYRKADSTLPNPRDHIVSDGETLCDHRVDLSKPGSIKSTEDVSKAEWALLFGPSSNLCGECMEIAEYGEHIPESIPEGEPEYQCPQCGEPAEKVDLEHVASVLHYSTAPARGTVHKVPREHYEQWRRNLPE